MAGKIESGQLCTVIPVRGEHLNVGDIVLCKVSGFQYLHLIKAIQGKLFQIGNNRGPHQRLDWGEWNLWQVCEDRVKLGATMPGEDISVL